VLVPLVKDLRAIFITLRIADKSGNNSSRPAAAATATATATMSGSTHRYMVHMAHTVDSGYMLYAMSHETGSALGCLIVVADVAKSGQ